MCSCNSVPVTTENLPCAEVIFCEIPIPHFSYHDNLFHCRSMVYHLLFMFQIHDAEKEGEWKPRLGAGPAAACSCLFEVYVASLRLRRRAGK